jgi:hypothetical protein
VDNLVPQTNDGISDVVRDVVIEKKSQDCEGSAICLATRTSISPRWSS